MLDNNAAVLKMAKGRAAVQEIRTVAGMRAMWLVHTLKGGVQGDKDAMLAEHLVAIAREDHVFRLILRTTSDRLSSASKEFEEVLKTLKVVGRQAKEQAEAE